MPFVPPRGFRYVWLEAVRAGEPVRGHVVDSHGEQNGAVYEQIALGNGDFAPVSPFAQIRADMLECRVNGEHGDHSYHLQDRHTARHDGPGMGFGPVPPGIRMRDDMIACHKSRAEVLVPPGVRVELGGTGVSVPDDEVGAAAGTGLAPRAPVVHVKGVAYKGAIEVRTRPAT